MRSDPIARFDSRFSDPVAGPTPWQDAAAAFRIEPAKVLTFAKEPHAHTSFRFS